MNEEKIHIDCSGLSDKGKVRPDNQDHYFIGELSKTLLVRDTTIPVENDSMFPGCTQGQVLVVADGIGGLNAGREASELALNTLIRYILHAMPSYYGVDESSRHELVANLKSALHWASERILQHAAEAAADTIMGSTLTMAYVLWPHAYIVHVGDSRCYLLRDGELWQVTRDHTMAQEMVDQGRLKPTEAERSVWSNGLTNVLGGTEDSDCEPEVFSVALTDGDALLLCTDGLTGSVSDDAIASELNQTRSCEATCAALVEAANKAGGADNTTVILARFVSRAEEETHMTPPAMANENEHSQQKHEPIPA